MTRSPVPPLFAASLLIAQGLAGPAYGQLVADAYETAPRVSLGEVIPTSLIQSESHRVVGGAEVQGNVLQFTVESNHGSYLIRTLPLLILRVHEIRTLTQAMDDYQRRNQQEVVAELRGVMNVGGDSMVDILTSPIATTSSLANQFFTQNIGQTVKEISQFSDPEVRRVPQPSRIPDVNLYENLEPTDPILASHKRAAAAHLDLDVYSSNPRVQAFLNTLARARASGHRNAGMVTVSMPRRPEVRIAKGRIDLEVRTTIARKTIRQLYKHNAAALKGIGVDPELFNAFLIHRALSPTHKTAITAYLVFLDGVGNRGALLQAAMHTENEEQAQGYVQMARMLAHNQEQTGGLQTLVSGGNVLMAISGQDDMLMVLPFDLLSWNADTDRVFTRLAEFADDKGYRSRELLLAGVATDTAKRQMKRRGFTLTERYLFRE